MKTKKILGQESWVLSSTKIQAALTRQAGHLGPVRFRIGGRWIQPYSIAPWVGEKLAAGTPQLLRALRGDFFCMPFGGNDAPYRGEKHPPHGETANGPWKLESSSDHRLHVSQQNTVRKGRVDKVIRLVPNHTAVYVRHTISGMKGPMPLGHHAMLKLSGDGAGRISTSRFVWGQVLPGRFEEPVSGGYSILKGGAKFSSLRRVPRNDGEWADLSVYPSREGYEDAVMMVADATLPFAWTALVVPGEKYVWFALKDPRVLRSTVFWMSNGGRHYPPWNGRHRHVIGLEEVTSYFHLGIDASARANPISRAGIPTTITLSPARPTTINYIMAMAEVPPGFDVVKRISASSDGQSVTLVSRSGEKLQTQIDSSFLYATDDVV